MKATDQLEEIIQVEAARIRSSWQHPERRLGLLEICRAVDLIVLSANHQAEEIVELCRQGANKAVSLFIDESCKELRTPLFPSNQHTFQWAQSVLQQCGRIAMCEKLLDYERAGLGKLSNQGDNFTFDVTPTYAGLEALELEEFEWLADSIMDELAPVRTMLDADKPEIHERMRSLVYRWADHYIGYTAAPEVDAYFHQMGLLATSRMTGQDGFDDSAKFGGLPFGVYKAAVSALVGWTIKHIHFALLLAKRHTDLYLQNLFTITADVETMAEELAGALGITTKEASQALSVLEVSPENARELCINGHAPPPLIRASSQQVIKPISGFLIGPFHCMIRNLRAQYRTDWDRQVNQREERFRSELFDLLPQNRLIKVPRNVSIKNGGQRLTDIDAVIIDRENGVAGLFQLKWQDDFGHSMRERAAKMKNFFREVNSWINVVEGFLSRSTMPEIHQVLGLPSSSPPMECLLFIVGRHFAHFSGDSEPDGRAAHGIWPQLVRLTHASPDAGDPIRSLYEALRNDSPVSREVSIPASGFRIGNSTITMAAVESRKRKP